MFKRKIIKPLRRRVFVNNNGTWGKGYQVMALSFSWLIHTITSFKRNTVKMSFRSFPFSMNLLLCVSLLSVASISIAEEKTGYDLLLEMAIPKPHEVELARKGVAEASIEKAWERPCPYVALEAEDGSAEGDQLYYRC